MKALLASLCTFTLLSAPLLTVSAPAEARTATQQRMENRTKAYKQKSAAKTAAARASRSGKR